MTAPCQTSRFQSRELPIDSFEAWKQIDEFPGYEVSNFGRVRSWRVGGNGARKIPESPRMLFQRDNQNGYPCVNLFNDTGSHLITVHSLVLSAFVCPRPSGYEAAHLNGDRSDRRLSNLTWVTKSTNEFHKKLHGTSADGERSYRARITVAQASEIKRRADAGASGRILAGEFGISETSVRSIKSGKSWSWAIAEYDARNL